MSHRSQSGPQTGGHVIHWARLYDFVTGLLGGSRRSSTIDRAQLRSGEKVLDVGCGPGALTMLAKERVGPTGEVHGIDPSAEMIALAQKKATKAGVDVEFRTAVIEALPYADGSFDVVLSSMMLHHLPEDVRRDGLSEIVRVLQPGGRLLALDLTGRGIQGRLMSLVGHRFPEDYDGILQGVMKDAGLSPQLLSTGENQFVTILATKAA